MEAKERERRGGSTEKRQLRLRWWWCWWWWDFDLLLRGVTFFLVGPFLPSLFLG